MLQKKSIFSAAPTAAVPPVVLACLLFLPGMAQSDGAPDKGWTAPKDVGKGSHDLMVIHSEYQAYQHYQQAYQQQAAREPAFKPSNFLALTADGSIVVDATASGDPKALLADLEKLGLKNGTASGHMVSGHLPISAIPALNGLASLRSAHPAYATTNSGSVTSQGDTAMRSDAARTLFGVDGTGITVGTLSDSFDCQGGAAAGIASGDLPAGISVLEEGPCPGTDEGRGMIELIHDVAPGATLSFHTAFKGQANFAQGIIDLANAGATVINDDVIYFNEPMFQDGIIAQAVNQVKARGVAYFSAALNYGRKSYESAFRPSGITIDYGRGPVQAHDFDPGPAVDICQQITIPAGRRLMLSLQWDQPFFSVSGAPGSANDIDVLLYNADCSTRITGSVLSNVGNDPAELLQFTNPAGSGATTFGVVITNVSGPYPGLIKTVLFGSGDITIDQFDTASGTSFGHSAAAGGLGVGAAFYQQTPAFGITPPRIESFSSAGGIPILFNTAGNRLAKPVIREQPDIVAPDGANTTFFVAGVDPENDGFPNFFGTSAAAPHAAAVAALMRHLVPSSTPDAIYGALKTTAIDMDDPQTPGFDTGFDFGTGHGFVQADAALEAIAFLLDDFNRPNGHVGPNWSWATSTIQYAIKNGRVTPNGVLPIYWNKAQFGPSQESFVTLTKVDSHGIKNALLLKVQSNSIGILNSYIEVQYNPLDKTVQVATLRSNSPLPTTYAAIYAPFKDGDRLDAKALSTGNIEIYRNGDKVGTVTLDSGDQAFFNRQGGYIGLWFVGSLNAFFDDFGGGTL